jgi:hypothetical protein
VSYGLGRPVCPDRELIHRGRVISELVAAYLEAEDGSGASISYAVLREPPSVATPSLWVIVTEISRYDTPCGPNPHQSAARRDLDVRRGNVDKSAHVPPKSGCYRESHE